MTLSDDVLEVVPFEDMFSAIIRDDAEDVAWYLTKSRFFFEPAVKHEMIAVALERKAIDVITYFMGGIFTHADYQAFVNTIKNKVNHHGIETLMAIDQGFMGSVAHTTLHELDPLFITPFIQQFLHDPNQFTLKVFEAYAIHLMDNKNELLKSLTYLNIVLADCKLCMTIEDQNQFLNSVKSAFISTNYSTNIESKIYSQTLSSFRRVGVPLSTKIMHFSQASLIYEKLTQLIETICNNVATTKEEKNNFKEYLEQCAINFHYGSIQRFNGSLTTFIKTIIGKINFKSIAIPCSTWSIYNNISSMIFTDPTVCAFKKLSATIKTLSHVDIFVTINNVLELLKSAYQDEIQNKNTAAADAIYNVMKDFEQHGICTLSKENNVFKCELTEAYRSAMQVVYNVNIENEDETELTTNSHMTLSQSNNH